MNLRSLLPGLLVVVLAASATALTAADELILKSGQKIVGTIVGYENNMFRVETDFGVALIRKDRVASIQIGTSGESAARGNDTKARAMPPNSKTGSPERATEPGPGPAASTAGGAKSKSASAPEELRREVATSSSSAAVKPSPPPPPASHPLDVPLPARLQEHSASAPEELRREVSTSSASTAVKPSPPPPPASHPLDVPLPAHLQEHLEGTTYVNDTFQFAMYKPPGWKIYEGVPRETGSGIMAMGTEDEQTLLIVDRQVWSGEPNLKHGGVEARLRSTYQDYQKLSEEPTQCDGRAAIWRGFKGVLDGVEWHGIAVDVANGNTVFGIMGLTSAETSQFQQAVLNKIIHSFRFLASTTETRGPSSGGPKR